MLIELSPLTPARLREAATVFCAAFAAPPWGETELTVAQITDYFRRQIATPGALSFVLLADGVVVGVSLGRQKTWLHGLEYQCDEFCLAPNRQGQGLGAAMMARITARLAAQGIHGWLLTTHAGYPAEAFYRHQGFAPLSGEVNLSRT